MMTNRLPSRWRWIAAAFLIAGLAVAAYRFVAGRAPGASVMMSYLPRAGATQVYADVGLMRKAGLLDAIAGSKSLEDAEYRKFVESTGFDYRRDLDSVAGAISGGQSFFVAAGRFDWKLLEKYMSSHGGSCRNSVCRGPAMTPGRSVSFYPLQRGLMAIAFSPNDAAVLDIAPRKAAQDFVPPEQPVWLLVPSSALREASLPAGTQSFTSPLLGAERILFILGAQDNRIELRLDVTCGSPAAAADLLIKLEGATNMLRKLIEREHMTPNANDISGLLTSGSFRRDDRKVYGVWPVSKEMVQSIASGTSN